MNLVSIVENSILRADNYLSKMPLDFPSGLSEESFSGIKGRALINNICGNDGIRYLEVGSYAGSTLCSALIGNSIDATACDIWGEFMGEPRGSYIKGLFNNRLEKYRGNNRVKVIESSIYSDDTIKNIGKGWNFYFYDADHTTESTEKGIIAVDSCMSDEFILMVDDYGMITTMQGVNNALSKLNYEILFSRKLGNLPVYDWYTYEGQAVVPDNDWWCNYFIAVLRKSK